MDDGAVKRSNNIAEAMHDINITLRRSVKNIIINAVGNVYTSKH